MNRIVNIIKREWSQYKLLLRSAPSLVMMSFCVSVILMNLLANRELQLNLSWLALDCGFLISWMSFLCMDMLTKRFGAKAAIQLSLTATVINLVVCGLLFIVTQVPGNWGEFYTYGMDEINLALDKTFGGTWYVLLGSTIAFIVSSIMNATINVSLGKMMKKDNFRAFAIRSYTSTVFAQVVDNFLFALIVSHTFFGWSMLQCITCSLTGGIAELFCEVIFSPVGYKACKRWDKEGVGANYLKTVKSN